MRASGYRHPSRCGRFRASATSTPRRARAGACSPRSSNKVASGRCALLLAVKSGKPWPIRVTLEPSEDTPLSSPTYQRVGGNNEVGERRTVSQDPRGSPKALELAGDREGSSFLSFFFSEPALFFFACE
ncbi:hypothetical protein NPIL_435591 [Nephila pilipes]|uniref:Uncharacterized protein n=1 Tax=Nephila pilipes TaxID=299642 RepID=A0A8X6PTJ7_NEPPI|nr:hypothetical protein NPIL_435591 [Nephila pilipes]